MDGKILQHLRKEKGWSQKQLAEKADIGESSVRAVELGLRTGSTKMARKLSCALGVTVETLEDKEVAIKSDRDTIVSNFIEMLVEENIITDPNNISEELTKLIMLNVKKEIEAIKNKKQV